MTGLDGDDVLLSALALFGAVGLGVYWYKMHQEWLDFKRKCDAYKRTADGRLLAIECKRPGKKATAEQWQFLCNVNRANGVAFVATCIEDVTRALT